MYLQLSIPHCIVNKILTPKFNVMFKLNYSKYNPRGLIFGGLIHGRSFPFQKLVPKRPRVIHGEAYYRNFTAFSISSLVKISPKIFEHF